jgi:hypothetical protein
MEQMARTADRVTVIRFANGRELVVQPSPDEVVRAIRNAEGGLTRVLDTNTNAAWINPEDIVTISSHRARRRRIGADKDEISGLTRAVFSDSAQ